MTRTNLLAFVAGAGVASGLAVLVGLGPDHDHKAGKGEPAHQMSPDEEMSAWMEACMPGEHHAELSKAVGTWTAQTRFIMDPSMPAVESTGTSTTSWVLGGRYLKSDFHLDDMMGMPFDGMGFTGYDNLKQEYVGTWMDTMGTGIMYMTGKKDGDKTVLTGKGMSPQGPVEMKIVTAWADNDHFTDTFYDKTPDGSWQESGKITYTRK